MIRSYELGVLFLPSAFVSPRGCLTLREQEGGGGLTAVSGREGAA